MMRIWSGKHPWWWAILHAGKRIENRRTPIAGSYRGPILLHASAGCTREYYGDAVAWMWRAGLIQSTDDVPPLASMQRGGIIGRARVVDVLLPHSVHHNVDLRWWMPEQFGYVLTDVEPVKFVPWRGALCLQRAPEDLLARIEAL